MGFHFNVGIGQMPCLTSKMRCSRAPVDGGDKHILYHVPTDAVSDHVCLMQRNQSAGSPHGSTTESNNQPQLVKYVRSL